MTTTYTPLPIPNFLIDPQDGAFTPYDARSLADSSEESDPHHHTDSEQPTLGFSPNTTTTRSRATSDALEKLLAVQARQLSSIAQAWRAKYSFSPIELSNQPLVESINKESYHSIPTLRITRPDTSDDHLLDSMDHAGIKDKDTIYSSREKSMAEIASSSLLNRGSSRSTESEDRSSEVRLIELRDEEDEENGVDGEVKRIRSPRLTRIALEDWNSQRPQVTESGQKDTDISRWINRLPSSFG